MRHVLIFIVIAVVLLSVVRSGVLGEAIPRGGVKINNGTPECVNCNGTQSKVTNNNVRAIFVPNATPAEFDSFKTWAQIPANNVAVGACGGCDGIQTMTITHTAGTVAPVTKTVVYNITATDIAGTGSKCWITQNLGADRQATAVDDATEASAGWYWQFNRKQGFYHDGTTRIPNTAWINSILEYSNWLPANDPCALLLGSGWRIPTYAEWSSAISGWTNAAGAFNSILKLHIAGFVLDSRGMSYGQYWSSTDVGNDIAWYLIMSTTSRKMWDFDKMFGNTLRCLRDAWVCGNAMLVKHVSGDGVAPVDKTVNYGTVLTSLSGASKCWITRNLGSDRQATVATDGTEESAGWYWQFNLKQGYKHDGAIRTPNTAWLGFAAFNENSDWISSKDPCTLLLGAGWRMPTRQEWLNAIANGGWLTVGYNATYASVLKIHAAGSLNNLGGVLNDRGSKGNYWSSTQSSTTAGYYLFDVSVSCQSSSVSKAYGHSVRCLKD